MLFWIVVAIIVSVYVPIMYKMINDLFWPKYFVRQSDMDGFVLPDRRTITIRKSEFQIEVERTEKMIAEIREEIRLCKKNQREQAWD